MERGDLQLSSLGSSIMYFLRVDVQDGEGEGEGPEEGGGMLVW